MKKIFTFIMVLLLHNGFCSNISKVANYNNDNLVQRMSKDQDVLKFFKLAVAKRISEEISVENTKNGINISTEDKVEFEKLGGKANFALEKIMTKYPEFKNLPIEAQAEVFKALGVLFYAEVIACFYGVYSTVKDVCGSIAKDEKAVFFTCCAVAAALDILVEISSSGTASAALPSAINAEFNICATLAKGLVWAKCLIPTLSVVVTCLAVGAGS